MGILIIMFIVGVVVLANGALMIYSPVLWARVLGWRFGGLEDSWPYFDPERYKEKPLIWETRIAGVFMCLFGVGCFYVVFGWIRGRPQGGGRAMSALRAFGWWVNSVGGVVGATMVIAGCLFLVAPGWCRRRLLFGQGGAAWAGDGLLRAYGAVAAVWGMSLMRFAG